MAHRLPAKVVFLASLLTPAAGWASPSDWTTVVVLTEATDVDETTSARLLKATADSCRGTALVVKAAPEDTDLALRRLGENPRACAAAVPCVTRLGKAAGARYVVAIGAARLDDSVAITVDIVDTNWERNVGHGARGLSDANDWTQVMSDVVTQALPDPMRRPTGTLVLTANLPDARVAVDGRAAGKTPVQPLPISPGEHEVSLTLDGYEPFRQTVEIEPGGDRELSVTLVRPKPLPPPPPPNKKRMAVYAAGGLSVAAVAAGVAFSLSQDTAVAAFCEKYRELYGERCGPTNPPRADPAELRELRESAERRGLYSTVSFAVAGAAAVAAGVLLYLDLSSAPVGGLDKEPDPPTAGRAPWELSAPAVGLAVTPGGAGVVLRGAFD